MPELREMFEMTTKQVEPDVDAWREQEGRQRRSTRNRRIGAFAVAAAIGVAAVAVILGTRGAPDTAMPANEPSTVTPAGPGPVDVATAFVEAYGAFDIQQAVNYLADDAEISGIGGTLEDFELGASWFEAMGYKQMLDRCEELGSSASGTRIRCHYDFHALRSDEIGLGPFGGSYFDLTVRDGEIVRASNSLNYNPEFSPQMWEPFAEWVSATYPEDAAVMYVDENLTDGRLTPKSFRLWEKHSREYVKVVEQGAAEAATSS